MTSSHHGKSQITIEGTPDEIKALEAMLLGTCLVGNPDAQSKPPLRTERYAKVAPSQDPEMSIIYDAIGKEEGVFELFDDFGKFSVEQRRCKAGQVPKFTTPTGFSPALLVQHICAYGRGHADYAEKSAELTRAGFVLMRSQRGPDGRYWEHWYLPYLPFTGPPFTHKKDIPPNLGEVVEWICERIVPGAIDIVNQRCGLAVVD